MLVGLGAGWSGPRRARTFGEGNVDTGVESCCDGVGTGAERVQDRTVGSMEQRMSKNRGHVQHPRPTTHTRLGKRTRGAVEVTRELKCSPARSGDQRAAGKETSASVGSGSADPEHGRGRGAERGVGREAREGTRGGGGGEGRRGVGAHSHHQSQSPPPTSILTLHLVSPTGLSAVVVAFVVSLPT